MNRAAIEAALPPTWVIVIRDLCARLGIPPARWPEAKPLVAFLDAAILSRTAALGSVDAACAELGVASPGAVKQRLYRYRRLAS